MFTKRARLLVEQLEPRCVPTGYTWNYMGMGTGSETDPNNWNPRGVPGGGDTNNHYQLGN